MIEIVLINKKVLKNDPAKGFNSRTIKEIWESLNEFGEYTITIDKSRFKVRKEHVVEIRETKE